MTPDAKEAKRKRGRAWNSRVERCDTCKFWTDRKSEFVGWRLCEKHNKWTHSDGGCAMHMKK